MIFRNSEGRGVNHNFVMTNNIIVTQDLTVFYGTHCGISDVNLSVEKGEVFGLLGPNGAGKTTIQRVFMDILRPVKGCALIFGQDCRHDGVAIRKRIGYLPGEFGFYPTMKGSSFINMLASMQAKPVDRTYLEELYQRMDVDPSRKMKEYSRGNKQKIGIVAAFMGKPDLLILDEPTAGLDPLMQKVVLDLVREAKENGRTVFFSSHNLPEVQAICDRVGILRGGKLIKTERVETLTKQQFKRLHLTLRQSPPTDAFALEGVSETGRIGQVFMLEVRQGLDKVMEKAVQYGVENIENLPVTLEELFLAYYGLENNGQDDA
jgi:ABC-2 type transport system ATP-binding protein